MQDPQNYKIRICRTMSNKITKLEYVGQRPIKLEYAGQWSHHHLTFMYMAKCSMMHCTSCTDLDVPNAVQWKKSSLASKGKRNGLAVVSWWLHSGRAPLANTTGSWICWISLFITFLLWNSSRGASNRILPTLPAYDKKSVELKRICPLHATLTWGWGGRSLETRLLSSTLLGHEKK